jgi:hypothetical protein
MTHNLKTPLVCDLADDELTAATGGLFVQTEVTKPIITAQMIANPDISGYFVPHINVIPKG